MSFAKKLREQAENDHVRGCQGRQYSCDCGYDGRTEALLFQAAAHIEALEAALRRAYDFLQDKAFTPDVLTHECTKVLEEMEAALAPEQDK